MKLVIAEKPSVGAEIAAVLGANEKKKGYSEGNGYIVSWCVGHLVEQAKPESYNEKYKYWSIGDLPILPERWKFEVLKGTAAQYRLLKELLARSDIDEVICATDAGREGECIFRYVYKLAKCQKPVKRLWVSSVEHSEIENGFANLKSDSEYDNLFNAGYARAKADWLVGINFSRLFSCLYNTHLNIGRVQTPTLNLIVQREEEIKNFTPKKYYTITLNFDGMRAESKRFDDYYDALKQLAECNRSTAIIKSVDRENKEVKPPKLFNLADLQKKSNKLLGYTAKQTLDIAQELYEKKLISYPRTDSNYVTSGMEDKIIQLMPLTVELMDTMIFTPNVSAVINDKKVSDHHALLPTVLIADEKAISNLLPSHKKILQLICSQMLCAVSVPYVYEQTVLKISCGDIDFTTKGSRIIDVGFNSLQNDIYKKIFGKTAEVKENILPDILAAGLVLDKTCEVLEHFTSAPKRFTDSSLISAMERAGNEDYEDDTAEKKGIGTSATRAGIIEHIIKNGFVERKSKNLVPTEKGITLIKTVPEEIKSPKMTADWESKLQQIEKGIFSDKEFLKDIERFVSEMTEKYMTEHKESDLFRPTVNCVGKCPKCGSDVIENIKAFDCSNTECGYMIWKIISGKVITDIIARELLEKGKTNMLSGFVSKKTGKKFSARLVTDDDGKISFEFK